MLVKKLISSLFFFLQKSFLVLALSSLLSAVLNSNPAKLFSDLTEALGHVQVHCYKIQMFLNQEIYIYIYLKKKEEKKHELKYVINPSESFKVPAQTE